MRIDIVTIFPEMFDAVKLWGVTRRAIETGKLDLRLWNPRDCTDDNYRRIDDRPYGGGPGMVMLAEPLAKTFKRVRNTRGSSRVIYLSPQGKRLEQGRIRELAALPALTLLAGRYEGIDERLLEQEVEEEISIGDYVLAGGELPAMVLIEGLVRYLPGVIGNNESVLSDSFSEGLLDWQHYTRPERFEGREVPPVLLGGDHEKIRLWRLRQALGRTWKRRPDLMGKLSLDAEQQTLLESYQREHEEEEILT